MDGDVSDRPVGPDRRRRRRAWLAPAAAVVLVAAGSVALTVSPASATPDLPARTAAQVVAAVLSSSTRALSGTVTSTADLGLPALPSGTSQASLSPQQLLTGTTTSRVWIDGPLRQRIAIQGQLSEADVVHDGADVWTYVSATNTVSHTTLPVPTDLGATVPPDLAGLSPTAVAARALTALDPTTSVTVSSTETVAGRSAYTLVLQPRDARSTVRQVEIAVDSDTGVPLQVRVFGAAQRPALTVGFVSVDFSTPAGSTFAFTAPAGATTTDDPFATSTGPDSSDATGPASTGPTVPTVIGAGWTTVVEFGAGSGPLPTSGRDLQQLTTALPNGARLLHTALLNAVLLADGRVFAGFVDPDVLEQIAATH